ncbi:unnamed protein product [Hermetia illucens]|uniref:BZIP domain-containing protein n=1 Tax=Hermetia illucens TaxID=343691 RepID=A0A7R8V7L7_HERIL|nr:transcription factor SPT20 homolog [Hermetia illucens]XP_037925617.1 transcription factor SPT20 homolog [Hermetia illucens]XP_037925618.1 transcription factor SPT20 homolog [Hermetia illucens]CAD7093914.1 unnamed protein product [Hermetia illucens]
MVAEFVARQQSGSPVNGETPHQNHTPSNMPAHGNANNSDMRLDTSSSILQINTNSSQSSNSRMLNSNGQNGQTFLHDHGNLLLTQDAMSPQSPGSDNYIGFDLAAQLKRKELFTQRKQREFIPENKKDDSYWDRRRRNNEAAKRSREKRRYNDMVLEQRVVELTKENHVLKAQLEAIKDKFNITAENLVSVDQIMATLPTSEQVLSITKRAKLTNSVPPTIIYPGSPSPAPPSTIHQPLGVDSPPSPTRLHHSQVAIHQQQPQQPLQPQPKLQTQAPPLAPHHHFRSCQSSSPPHMDYREAEVSYHQQHARNPPTLHHHHRHHHPSHPHVQFTTTANITTLPATSNVPAPVSAASQLSATAAVALATNISNICYTATGAVNVLAAAQAAAAGTPLNELHPYDATLVTAAGNVLNLSRRAQSPYELSSGAGSGTASGDDEQCDNQPSNDINNSLPLKLRHKSHLGDKDAATALLALQHIKQEPSSRSPPWDGEGSSDERDSGISIGTDWVAGFQRKTSPVNDKEEENIHLKSQLARLESEVATIKNMMILNTTPGQGATATAQ